MTDLATLVAKPLGKDFFDPFPLRPLQLLRLRLRLPPPVPGADECAGGAGDAGDAALGFTDCSNLVN